MKKFYLYLLPVFLLVSCSNEDTSNGNTHLLQKVVFYPNLPSEKHWNFNDAGFLESITKPDGTLIEKFVYNNNNQVIQNLIYVNGNLSQTLDISYNGNLIANSGVTYISSQNSYQIIDGYNTTTISLTNDLLLSEMHKLYDDNIDQYDSHYYVNHNNNGNMTSYSSDEFGGYSYVNYYEFDNKTNPLKSAIMPVMKVKTLYSPRFFYDGLTSSNNIAALKYHVEDPESSKFTYEYNENNLPVVKTVNLYYQGVYENISYEYTHYYYQGDVLP